MKKNLHDFSSRLGFCIFVSILSLGLFYHSGLSDQEPSKYFTLNSVQANLLQWWEAPDALDAPLTLENDAGSREWIQTETSKSQKQEVARPRLRAQEPYPVFLEVNNQNPVVGDVVIFSGGTELDIRDVQYQFVYGDGEKSDWQSEPEANYVYTRPGKYEAFLTVKVGRRNFQSKKVPITVRAIQLILKRMTDDPLYVGMPVRFEVISNSPMKGFMFQFHFGDGSAPKWLEERTVEHIYSAEGTYEVLAYASRGIPEMRYARRTEARFIRSEPILVSLKRRQQRYRVSLKPDRNRIKAGERIRFRADFTPFNQEVEYKFNFGDGQESDWTREPEIEHLYRNSGEFPASVRVRMRNKDLAESPIVGILVEDIEHKAYLKISSRNPFVGEDVMFEGGIEPGADNVQYRFDFGDQIKSGWLTEPVSTHIYNEPGTYAVTLTARIGEDIFQSNQVNVRVEGVEFQPRIEALPARVKPGKRVVFRAVIEPTVEAIDYKFIFGDGEQSGWSAEAEAEHTYSEEGTYPAYVTARRAQEYESMSDPILIEVSHMRDWMLWPAIGIGALIVFAGGAFVSSRIARAKAARKAEEFKIRARPKKDPGIQDIKIEKAEHSNLGLRIKPVRDTGSQKIQAEGSLIAQKEGNHA